MVAVSAVWRLTSTTRRKMFIIIKDISNMVKEKGNIMTDNGDINKMTSIKSYKIIKSQQDKTHINNTDVVIKEKEYITLTRKVKMVPVIYINHSQFIITVSILYLHLSLLYSTIFEYVNIVSHCRGL